MYQMPLINQYICLFEFFHYQFDLSCCLSGAMQQVQLSNQTKIRTVHYRVDSLLIINQPIVPVSRI